MPEPTARSVSLPPEMIARLSATATAWLNNGSRIHSDTYHALKAVWIELKAHTADELDAEGKHELAGIMRRAPRRTEMLQLKFSGITAAAIAYTDAPNEQTADTLTNEWARLLYRLRAEAERAHDQDTTSPHARA